MRFLDEVPQTPLVLGELAGAKVLLDLLLDVGRLFLHLVDDMLLAGVELVLAARLQVDLIDAPEVKVFGESHDAHLVDDVKTPGPVKIEHGVEGPRVTIEEVLVVDERVRVAEVKDLLVSRRLRGKSPESGSGDCLQHHPHDLVSDSAYVEGNSLVQLAGLGDDERIC